MAMRSPKKIGQSVKNRLLNLSHQKGQQYQLLLTRYLQERLLYRLSVSPFREHFILKGGALLYAHERFEARPTLDIDFLGNNISREVINIMNAMKELCSIECTADGVLYHADTMRAQSIAVDKRYPGVRITVTATLDSIRQDVSMDIGFGDVITPNPVLLDYPSLLDNDMGHKTKRSLMRSAVSSESL